MLRLDAAQLTNLAWLLSTDLSLVQTLNAKVN